MTSAHQLRRAADVVHHAGVLAYPTEAVFGLGCDPWEPTAVRRILDIKGRTAAKGLILIAAEPAQIAPFIASIPEAARDRVLDSWPGPVTWILPAHPRVPNWLTGGRPTIAVRVTSHPIAAALCRACGSALVSTSANRSGQAPARTALQIRLHLAHRYDYLVPGHCGHQTRPSTIIDAASGRVLRA